MIRLVLMFCAAALLAAWPAGAQQRILPPISLHIDEQPGYEPSEDEERLDPAWQRQVVFFRTTEAPGTIIVDTEQRFL